MNQFRDILIHMQNGFSGEAVSTTQILTMLLMVSVFSFYEFLVYRYVSKRSFYSKHFNIALAIIPFFVASIIMALQSSLVVALGTIGALAIIRFRTAIKDPLDMVYLFWSVHTGIVVGTGIYEAAFLTSLVVTIFLLLLDLMPTGRAPFLLVIQLEALDAEAEVLSLIRTYARAVRVKSRNYSSHGIDLILELRTKQESELMKAVVQCETVVHASLVAHHGEKEF